MDWHLDQVQKNILVGNYGQHVVYRMQELLRKYILPRDKHILVVGSETPWIEVLLLYEGAGKITTLEYNTYPTNHHNITTISPIEFAKLVNANQAPMFDAMVTFSSLEHSGLGRYSIFTNS